MKSLSCTDIAYIFSCTVDFLSTFYPLLHGHPIILRLITMHPWGVQQNRFNWISVMCICIINILFMKLLLILLFAQQSFRPTLELRQCTWHSNVLSVSHNTWSQGSSLQWYMSMQCERVKAWIYPWTIEKLWKKLWLTLKREVTLAI